MSPRVTAATALRVIAQLRRDPRTVAMLLLVPALLLTLLRFLFDDDPQRWDAIGAPVLGLFPFITMFLVTSITMLRERTTGTLERLMTLPITKLDLLVGYGMAFALVATAQAAVSSAVAFWLLGLDTAGSAWTVLGLAVANAVLGMALGLFVSAFARTEFQAVQFMPALVLPQILLCGLFAPRDQMVAAFDWIAGVLPLTYAYEGLRDASTGATGDLALDLAVVLGSTLAALALGAATLRRRTA